MRSDAQSGHLKRLAVPHASLGVVGLSAGAGQVSAMKPLNLQAAANALPTAGQQHSNSLTSAHVQRNSAMQYSRCSALNTERATLMVGMEAKACRAQVTPQWSLQGQPCSSRY